MEPLPLIRASQLAPFVAALERLGLPTERHLRRARLPVGWREQPNSLISERQLWEFIEEVADKEGVHDLGARAAREGQVCDIGPFGLQLVQSITLLDALRAMTEEVEVHSSQAQFGLSIGIHYARFWRTGIRSIDIGQDQVEQYTLLFMIQIVQLAAGPRWRPARVQLQAARAPWLVDSEVLGEASVELGAKTTSVELAVELLSRPLPRGDAKWLASPAIGPQPATGLVGSLRQALEPLVGQEPLHAELAAELLRTSVRTMERRLQDVGLTWRGLYDQILCDAATHRLYEPERSVTDIAHELGYSDSGNFSRAFKRWTGITPSAFRRDVSEDASKRS